MNIMKELITWLKQLPTMIEKKECVDILNAMVKGTPVDFNKQLFPLINEYLDNSNYERKDDMIKAIAQNPSLATNIVPSAMDYFRKKFSISSLSFNNKILAYYE